MLHGLKGRTWQISIQTNLSFSVLASRAKDFITALLLRDFWNNLIKQCNQIGAEECNQICADECYMAVIYEYYFHL